MNTRRQLVRLLLPLAIVVGGILVGVYLAGQQQILEKKAAPLCPQEATCRWDGSSERLSYRYEIVDLILGAMVVSGETNESYITFTPLPLHRYECRVRAVNSCGESEESVGIATCRQKVLISPTLASGLGGFPTTSASFSATIAPESSVSATPTEIASTSAIVVLSPTESLIAETISTTYGEIPTGVWISEVSPTDFPIVETPTPTSVKSFLIAAISVITTASRILSFITFGLVIVAVGIMVYRRKKRT